MLLRHRSHPVNRVEPPPGAIKNASRCRSPKVELISHRSTRVSRAIAMISGSSRRMIVTRPALRATLRLGNALLAKCVQCVVAKGRARGRAAATGASEAIEPTRCCRKVQCELALALATAYVEPNLDRGNRQGGEGDGLDRDAKGVPIAEVTELGIALGDEVAHFLLDRGRFDATSRRAGIARERRKILLDAAVIAFVSPCYRRADRCDRCPCRGRRTPHKEIEGGPARRPPREQAERQSAPPPRQGGQRLKRQVRLRP